MIKEIYTVVDCLQYNYENYPNNIAIVENDKEYTYSDVYQMVNYFTSYLIKNGIKRYDRVCIYMPNCIEFVIAIFSILRIGGVFVPINKILKTSQAKYIYENCEANGIIVLSEQIKENNIKYKFDNLIEFPQVFKYSYDMTKEFPRNIGTDLAAIIYTSGSTGFPKGVMISHNNFIEGSRIVSDYLNLSENDRILGLLSLSFDYGLNQLLSAFYVHASIFFQKDFLINQIPYLLNHYKITGLAGVPSIWIQLTQLNKLNKYEYNKLRYITNSGGRLSLKCIKELKKHFVNTEIYLMYGLTESFRSTYLAPIMIEEKYDSVGKAIPNTEVYIINQNGYECKPFEIGEIVSRGPLVTLGYWNDIKSTNKVFKTNPINLQSNERVVYSGDKGYKDSEGYVFFVARDNQIIKSKGYRTNPTQIEDVLYTISGILECMVMGVENNYSGDDDIIAYIRVKNNTDRKKFINLINETCRLQLPHYMCPSDIVFVQSFYKTTSGKYDFVKHKEEYLKKQHYDRMR